MLAIRILSVAVLFSLATQSLLLAQGGTWSELKIANPAGTTGTMLQLTDGTVISNASSTLTSPVLDTWEKLTPDAGGSYITGMWSAISPMLTARVYFASNILPTGQVLVIGGVTSFAVGSGATYTNLGEVYNPATDRWTSIASFSTFSPASLGNAPTKLLNNGNILAGCISGPQTFLYNPTTDTWSQTTGNKLRLEPSTNESWCLLPDGSVLSYDVNISPATGAGTAQRYIPSTGLWVNAGTVPVPLSGAAYGNTVGPMTLLPDGRVIIVGANQNTALYSPATNTWAAGPKLPANMGADTAPGAMLPNGMFIFAADTSTPADSTKPTKLYEFNYLTNLLTDVTPTGALGLELSKLGSNSSRMLVLPNGHMLLTNGAGTVWDFTPNNSPNPEWRPTISNITQGTGANASIYTLTGTQLTGISEGACFGSDGEVSTNFPIVQLTDPSKHVLYGTTSNWKPGISTGAVVSTVQFTLPTTLTTQTYQLSVIANGIPSTPVTFRYPYSSSGPIYNYVTANFNGSVLTLTGDASANAVAISQRGNIVTTQGAGLTLIQVAETGSWLNNSTTVTLSGANSFITAGMPVAGTGIAAGSTVVSVSGTSLKLSKNTTAAGTGILLSFSGLQQVSFSTAVPFPIVCNFAQGTASDTVSLTSVNSTTTKIDFSDNGGGGNTANVTYCTIGTLTIDGGAHATGNPNIYNYVNYVSSKITTKNIINVP